MDIEEVMLDRCLKKVNEKNQMMEFKARAEPTFGTDHEMSFYEIESGLFSSMHADGRNAMKDIMEKIPCKHPVNTNGEKMTDRGKGKNIICSFGLVEGVARTLYIDESGYETVYPLDEKLGLINIKDTKSQYMQRFAHILLELIAEGNSQNLS